MKKIFQDLKSGETSVDDVLCSQGVPGQLLISTSKTLVSVGTERMLVDFGKANRVEKALEQPDIFK
jgi:hypothetical protein